MSTIVASPNGIIPLVAGQKLLGEIITWSASGVKVKHLDLIDALRGCELEENVARELAPRHAFARACKKLKEARIIRQVSEDQNTLTFQFTQERKEEDRYSYDFETLLSLEKSTGKVTCSLPGLATLAQEELDRCIEARTGGDITRVVQRLFERKADLFPIREQGGAYFVPEVHTPFLERIERFLSKLNGRINRFPVPAGTPHGDRSVKDAVTNGLAALIAEHNAAIETFGKDTRADTIERAAERIRLTKHKLEAYSCYLAEERSNLERDLADASKRLRLKVEAIATSSTTS